MGRSHCCDKPCQANLTKYAGGTGKIQWQKALFGEGFINSSYSAPNSPADVLSVVASTTAGVLWVTLIERRDAENRPRLLLVESATGAVRKVVADCYPAGVTPPSVTYKPSRRNVVPLTGGRCAVFGREVNSGTTYKVLIVDAEGVVTSSFVPNYNASDITGTTLAAFASDTIVVNTIGGTNPTRAYDLSGSELWAITVTNNLIDCTTGGVALSVKTDPFTPTGAGITLAEATGSTVNSKTVSGGVQAGCVAGTGFALARADINEILLCDSTLGTTATISANVTSGGAVLAGDTSRFAAACDRVRYYNTAGTQQWSELVPSNSFTSIALDADGDVYVGSVRGNVRTEGTTVNGF